MSEIERGRVVKVLRGHVDADSAHVEQDYPDGFRIRCKRRSWTETATKGQSKGQTRLVAQTSDERHGRPDFWRKPKASTYVSHLWLCEFENGHVDGVAISMTYYGIDRFVYFYNTGIWPHLDDGERKFFLRFQDAIAARRPQDFEKFNALAAAIGDDTDQPVPLEQVRAVPQLRFTREDDYEQAVIYLRNGGPRFGVGVIDLDT